MLGEEDSDTEQPEEEGAAEVAETLLAAVGDSDLCPRTSGRFDKYVVELWPFAHGRSYYAQLFASLQKNSELVINLTTTSHPASFFAARKLGKSALVLQEKVTTHTLGHSKELLAPLLAKPISALCLWAVALFGLDTKTKCAFGLLGCANACKAVCALGPSLPPALSYLILFQARPKHFFELLGSSVQFFLEDLLQVSNRCHKRLQLTAGEAFIRGPRLSLEDQVACPYDICLDGKWHDGINQSRWEVEQLSKLVQKLVAEQLQEGYLFVLTFVFARLSKAPLHFTERVAYKCLRAKAFLVHPTAPSGLS